MAQDRDEYLSPGQIARTLRPIKVAERDPEVRFDDFDFADLLPPRLTPAAVLVLLAPTDSGYSFLLTERHAALRTHAGQISFPGGRMDDADDSLLATALRETHEEVGVEPEAIELLGTLPTFPTITGFSMLPVVGRVAAIPKLVLDPIEVEDAFWMPLDRALDLNHYRSESKEFRGKMREYQVLSHPHHFIWGATAAILHRWARHWQSIQK